MYNWSTDTRELKKNKEKYTIWRLEQMINYGLQGEKLPEKLIKKYWSKLHIEPQYKKYLQFLLWKTQS